MCGNPFKAVGKAVKSVVSGVAGAATGLIGGITGGALSQPQIPAAQENPGQFLQEQVQADAAAAADARRRRRTGPGSVTPTFLTEGANRGIVTGGASLLGGGAL